MKLNAEFFLAFLILLSLVLMIPKDKPVKGYLDAPYTVKVINDHEVQLVCGPDTVTLLLENAYNLSDESIIFINK